MGVIGAIGLIWITSKQIPRKLDDLILGMYHDAEGMAKVLTGITIFLIILGLYLIDVNFLQ